MADFKTVCKNIAKISPDIRVREDRGLIILEGELDKWEDVVAAGQAAVDKKRYLGVINNIKLKGFEPRMRMPGFYDDAYDGIAPDVLIIGGGVVGCAIARELSALRLNTVLAEKSSDVATGASSRNDGCVHVGIDLKPGQVKLKYNGRGNEMYTALCADLGVPFERKGHILLFYRKWERLLAPAFRAVARANKIKGVEYINEKKLKELEPYAPDWAKGAMLMKSGGIVSPYKLTVALAENAAVNGVGFALDTAVTDMEVQDGKIVSVTTNRGKIYPKLVINAAGVYSDFIADLAGDRTFTIHPRKGINFIFDKKVGKLSNTSLAKSPFAIVPDDGVEPPKGLINKIKAFKDMVNSKSHTKGGGVIHTADGNLLVGPNAIEVPDKEDYTTDIDSLNAIYRKQKQTAQKLKMSDAITYFAGTRAATYEEDFVVRKGIFTENIIEAAGIQSPGLTAAPAIAQDVALWAAEYLSRFGKVEKNPSFNPVRKPIPHLAELDSRTRDEMIKKNPDYGVIVCRCEEISKGEILDAVRSPVPATTVDAVKRRVRPGMGRCQGGFCSPLVVKIIADELNISPECVLKGDTGSNILFGKTKGGEL